jgi:hypothetical protein
MSSSTILDLPRKLLPAMAPGQQKAERPAPSGDLAALFRAHRWRILATYLLFNLENLARLAQLWFLGWAVNDLLAGRSTGLLLFAAQHLVNVGLSTVRQAYDTRTFTRIYADLAARLMIDQRRRGVDISRLAARSTLAREVVDFFERDMPCLFFTLYSAAGSLVMIALFDSMLVLPCLGFLAVAALLGRSLGRRTLQLNSGLNDQIEREVGILENEPADQVEDHYHQLRGWRIRLSNAQVINFGAVELLVLLLMALVLIRSCAGAATDPGSLLSVLGYVAMLANSLANLPMWIQQFSRLRDIRRRLHQPNPDA